jgi:hypothetical protein
LWYRSRVRERTALLDVSSTFADGGSDGGSGNGCRGRGRSAFSDSKGVLAVLPGSDGSEGDGGESEDGEEVEELHLESVLSVDGSVKGRGE